MENKDNILIEIEEMAANLSKIKKENVFGTPNQYFEELSSNVQKKINVSSRESRLIKVIHLFQQPQYSVAATLIVIFLISGIYLYKNKQEQYSQHKNIYWDEILNDNTIVDKVDETLLVEAYINESEAVMRVVEDVVNQSDMSEEELSDFFDKEYVNDIFIEM